MNKLRAAVIGAGYLGKYHVQKFAALQDIELAAVVDVDLGRAEEAGRQAGAPAYADHRKILDKVDLVSIVVPTECHYRVAKECLEAGVHILVEKPVTQTAQEAAHLIELANARKLVFQVGHLERFNPVVLAMQGILNNPMFIESHRLAPFKARGTDVDVVLDLMIHDIDIILNMVESEVSEVKSMGIPVMTDEMDIANARIEFKNGCVANVTASRVSNKSMRKIRVFQPDAYISIDCLARNMSILRKQHKPSREFPEITVEEKSFEQADPLATEIRAFVDAVRSGSPPVVSGADGKRALEIALAINTGMAKSRN